MRLKYIERKSALVRFENFEICYLLWALYKSKNSDAMTSSEVHEKLIRFLEKLDRDINKLPDGFFDIP
tara:strand:- start:771 stop:974 length:204 start_codon:yes stop_codon:yes gene_type:complete